MLDKFEYFLLRGETDGDSCRATDNHAKFCDSSFCDRSYDWHTRCPKNFPLASTKNLHLKYFRKFTCGRFQLIKEKGLV